MKRDDPYFSWRILWTSDLKNKFTIDMKSQVQNVQQVGDSRFNSEFGHNHSIKPIINSSNVIKFSFVLFETISLSSFRPWSRVTDFRCNFDWLSKLMQVDDSKSNYFNKSIVRRSPIISKIITLIDSFFQIWSSKFFNVSCLYLIMIEVYKAV